MRRPLTLLMTLACLFLFTSGIGADQQAEAVDLQTTAPAAVQSDELTDDPATELLIGDCCKVKSDCPDNSPYVKLVACDCGYYCSNVGKPCSCTYRVQF
jgi:hypothetical protein